MQLPLLYTEARAAFGVILVTTKKGNKDSHFAINYSNNFSFSKQRIYPIKLHRCRLCKAIRMPVLFLTRQASDVYKWLELLKEYNNNPNAYPEGYAMVDGLRYSLQETDLLDDMMETGFNKHTILELLVVVLKYHTVCLLV